MTSLAGAYVAGSEAWVEDLEWMAANGEGLTGAARRVGMTRDTLEKRLGKGRLELYALKARLLANDLLPIVDVEKLYCAPRWKRAS